MGQPFSHDRMHVIDLLLRGGLVVDGTGARPRVADVGVDRGRVVLQEPGSTESALVELDVRDRVVSPGFVDIHTHSDLTLLSAPSARSKVAQGVTTEVVGNCGLGLAPLPPGSPVDPIRAAVGYLDLDPGVQVSWHRLADYLAAVATARPSVNVAAFVAHLPLHGGVVGLGDQPAGAAELDVMCGLLDEALGDGGVGLSTGLAYAPLCFADERELLALASVVARRGALFAWHLRDYGDRLIPSVEQALRVAATTGCRTQISHLVSVGRRNWGAVVEALDLVDRARADGLDVGVDMYPYTAGSAPLSQLLPEWAQDGGIEEVQRRLRQPAVRDRIRSAWVDRPLGWDEIVLNWLPESAPTMVGRTIASVAESLGSTGDDVALDLLRDYGGAALMVAYGRSEDDLRTVLRHPAAVVASDGLALDPDGVTGTGLPHPRSYGCFPRFLSRYAGDDLADAIRRCTSAPADRVGMADRGRLAVGLPADITVLDLARLDDLATYERPHAYPSGVDLVMVAGEVVVQAGEHTGARPGTALRRPREGAQS
ncbi:MAG: amidohydrolase family protein [Propionibacteriales bacterium]|nr:amidohydrolase family protein [Propionibacteriales bacterium]